MTIFALGKEMAELSPAAAEEADRPLVFLVSSKEAPEALRLSGISFDGELSPARADFCKMESQQQCLYGSLRIPRLLDVLGSSYKMILLIDRRSIIIIDEDDFARRLVLRFQKNKSDPGETRESFLCHFFLQFLNRDLELLNQYERRIMALEEQVMEGNLEHFESLIMPIRRELLTLRSYYDELTDVGRELEQDENRFFAPKARKYFGVISDRADRLMGKTSHLLEYAQQVRDAYQAGVNAEQNRNMEFLTVISTIFFPLTLITGWFGMNFTHMPWLEDGYKWVILLSLLVLAVCIFIFKKKKML